MFHSTEQLVAMPLEDKDHQGGTQGCTSNEHYLVNQDLRKLRKDDEGRAYNFPHAHLLDQILQRKKNKMQGEVFAQGT